MECPSNDNYLICMQPFSCIAAQDCNFLNAINSGCTLVQGARFLRHFFTAGNTVCASHELIASARQQQKSTALGLLFPEVGLDHLLEKCSWNEVADACL